MAYDLALEIGRSTGDFSLPLSFAQDLSKTCELVASRKFPQRWNMNHTCQLASPAFGKKARQSPGGWKVAAMKPSIYIYIYIFIYHTFEGT